MPSLERIRRFSQGQAESAPEQAGAQAPLALALQDQAGQMGTVERPKRSEGKLALGATAASLVFGHPVLGTFVRLRIGTMSPAKGKIAVQTAFFLRQQCRLGSQ